MSSRLIRFFDCDRINPNLESESLWLESSLADLVNSPGHKPFKECYTTVVRSNKKNMTWFKDNNSHVLESKNKLHRLLYCPLCQKLLAKGECRQLRQDRHGKLYEVRRYNFDRSHREQRLASRSRRKDRRKQEVSSLELSRIVKRII